MKSTHTIYKTGRETLPLTIPQVELLSEFYEKRQIFMVQCTMVDFELILARVCDAFWVTIRNLVDFSVAISILFADLCAVLSPGEPDRSRFGVEFGVVLKFIRRKRNGQTPLHGPHVAR